MQEEVLKIEGLVKKYGDKLQLDDINLTVKRGEVVVILGPSGCGKSTLLRCINLLEPIQGGKIFIDDEEITSKDANLPLLRQKIGMVFQNYELFVHLNVMKNILLAPVKVQKRNKDEVKKEAEELLEMVGLKGYGNMLPRQLSGGEKQRVAIVRTLIMHPDILLLDEITASLDPERVREVLNVVLKLSKEGKTMVIVTHEMDFAKNIADRIVFIDDHKIVEENTPKEFFENPKTDRAKKFLAMFDYSH